MIKIKKYQINNGSNKELFGKLVCKINKQTDELIDIYDSVKKASYDVNRDSSCIFNCLSGRVKSCAGFKWKYYTGIFTIRKKYS